MMVTGILMFLLLFNNAIREPRDPGAREQSVFQEQFRELQARLRLLPHPVDEIMATFSDTLRFAFECAGGMKMSHVTVKVTTRQVGWDPDIKVEGKGIDVPETAVGYYIWYPTIRSRGIIERINSNNLIMLNLKDRTVGHDIFGFLAKQSLLYHELLHGQLLLDAMKQRFWRRKACDCEFDFEPQDAQHRRITKLVHSYLRQLSLQHQQLYPIDVGSDGRNRNFEVAFENSDIMSANQEWEARYFFPEQSNVDPASFVVRLSDQDVVASGKLEELGKGGFVIVYLGPKK